MEAISDLAKGQCLHTPRKGARLVPKQTFGIQFHWMKGVWEGRRRDVRPEQAIMSNPGLAEEKEEDNRHLFHIKLKLFKNKFKISKIELKHIFY